MGDIDQWDPTVPSPFDIEAQEIEIRTRDHQRRSLYEIRERLQRAMIVGDRFNCIEKQEDIVDSTYVPVSNNTHRVLGGPNTEVQYASNSATSLLLSRQFEGISRKDIVIQESDERLTLVQSIFAMVMLQQQRETTASLRAARAAVAQAEGREREVRALLSTRMLELESSCRRRTEAAADECFALMTRDAGRAYQMATVGHATAQRNWLTQEEERGRASLLVECERQLSRLFSMELGECQSIRNRELIQQKVPFGPTALIDAGSPGSVRFDVSTSRRTAAGDSSHRSLNGQDQDFVPGKSAVEPEEYATDADLVPVAPAPQGFAESETSSVDAADNPNSFTPYWGWMFKSTGVLMTWQRRFFVFTTRGKLKCAASDKGPWHVVLSSNNITRVEVDSYHDAAGGVAPPTSQYHQYGFYVEAIDPTSPGRPKRLRFCCFSRKELNAWLTVLRRATDVIFALEESGSIARSPGRRRLDLSDERTRLAIRNLSLRQSVVGDASVVTAAPPTYRRRTQLEEEFSSIEYRRAEAERSRAQKQVVASSSPTRGYYNVPSDTFGRPPGLHSGYDSDSGVHQQLGGSASKHVY